MKTFVKKTKRPTHPARRTRAATLPFFNPTAQAQRAQVRQVLRAPQVQAKLTISQPNDKYEQEADRVADEVMRMPEPAVQRQSKDYEEKQEKLIQTKSEGPTPLVTPSLEASINALQGGGQPLPESARTFFEPRFGADFSGVRVNTGGTAAKLSRKLNAQAFTHGENIYFDAGRYNPGTSSGKRLLGHELTHVVQQIGGLHTKLTLRPLGGDHEHEAGEATRRIIKREQYPPMKSATFKRLSIQRLANPETNDSATYQPKTIILKNIPWEANYGLFEKRIINEIVKIKYKIPIPYNAYISILENSNLKAVSYDIIKPKGARLEKVTLRVDIEPPRFKKPPPNEFSDWPPERVHSWRLNFRLLGASFPREESVAERVVPRKHVKLTFAGLEFDFGLIEAIDMIENWAESGITTIRSQQELNNEWWGVVSFWSEVLGGVSIPNTGRFGSVLTALQDARKRVKEAYDPEFQHNPDLVKNSLDLAASNLRIAQIRFNSAKKEWNEYRKSVIKGASIGKRVCELTIVVITAPAQLPLQSAVLAGAAETALQLGKRYFVGDKIDVVDILQATAMAYITCLVSGKMRKLFDSTLATHGDKVVKMVNKLDEQVLKQGMLFSLNGVLDEFRGKHASVEQITERLVDRLTSVPLGIISKNIKL